MRERPIALFESWRGRYADSPRAISERLGERHPEIRQIWVANEGTSLPAGVDRVVRHTPTYFARLATCDLLVANDIVSKHLVKGPRVHYLQTWHGTPLKVIGHDEQMPAYDNAKVLARQDRDVRKWDALLSSGPECTAMFRSAFQFDGQVLEVGYPRNDVLRSAEAPAIRERVRRDLGLEESATAVLYAPTWRDDVQRPDGTFGDPGGLDVDAFTTATGDDTVVLMRMHSVVSTRRGRDASGRVLDVSDHPEIAELYLAADVLVSDYSSAIYDFAVTGKPVVLFAYDLEHYRDGIRGMYLDYEDWAPGPIVTTVDELADTVTAVTLPGGMDPWKGRYEQFVQRFCPDEDGGATDRVIDRFIEPLL